MKYLRWIRYQWHLWRYGDRWPVHSYGCPVCEDR